MIKESQYFNISPLAMRTRVHILVAGFGCKERNQLTELKHLNPKKLKTQARTSTPSRQTDGKNYVSSFID